METEQNDLLLYGINSTTITKILMEVFLVKFLIITTNTYFSDQRHRCIFNLFAYIYMLVEQMSSHPLDM